MGAVFFVRIDIMEKPLALPPLLERIRIHMKSLFVDYPSWVFDVMFFGSVGMLVGFFIRICGKLVAIALVLTLAALWLLQWYDLIVVKADIPATLFGYHVSDTRTFIEGITEAIKASPLATISAIGGFMIGWRMGR